MLMQPLQDSSDPIAVLLEEYDIIDSDLVRFIREAVAAPLKQYLGDDFRTAERIVLNGH
jgi:hypothetical protein